jgi:hypothetical protein
VDFDSNRDRGPTEPVNTSDLFLMHTDGDEQTLLLRGSSASWSPGSKQIVFRRSAPGTVLPIKTDPGAATTATSSSNRSSRFPVSVRSVSRCRS